MRDQSQPTLGDARELLDWRPRLGVLSIYLRIDPGDRGGAWRGFVEVATMAALEQGY